MGYTTPIFADTTASVTVTMQFAVTNGITNFKIIYISDTQMDLSWTLTSASNIMIRAKYGDYPSDIPNDTTTPSDGYLVYYGSGSSVSDTSMNFDQNPGLLYYKAWGQKADGTWYVQTSTGSKESKELILLSFIAIIIGLLVVNIMAKNSFIPIKLVAAMAWAIPLVWAIEYPPSFIVAGSNIQTIIVIILIGMLLICGFQAFRSPLQMGRTRIGKNGETENTSEDSGSWRMPNFVKNSYRNVTSYQPTGKERTNRMFSNYSAYRQQVHASLFPRENNRRRR